ncbi:sterol desaturase family protein [Pedobacter nutrimenti]|uniref:Sterol desaturase/sphingolipid hydroxylase (Fatty acid hydroxylase superfamily) n=1 Tax=Pedobacter nutrimenti TaxID=1241337 RepID=A0A318U8B8_9SPHI|nr:sterol desaturase family protein [Pedobacter nutrimenti]PYF70703.1 sterol desaturase/sphingolipid hydroxylase (fatty acid hydroxylase superfamily) [Pedobacter nutrimenti]
MNIIHLLYEELTGFFGLGGLIKMVQSGNYGVLSTLEGIQMLMGPIIPLLLLLEILRGLFYKRFKIDEYKMPFLVFVLNRFISRFISIAAVAFCIGLLEKWAIFHSTFTWYWLIYGYIVWELSHFVYHYFGHKVRILWCLHSTHHAPQQMNLSVNFAHFFLEAPYADVVRTSICILLGVNPALLFFIMFIDGFWGSFIHIGENVIKDGRLGFLNKILLTPSHHRVHHAKNPLYLDTNFCNLLNIWDKVFKTYQEERTDLKIEYGITREMNPNSLWDVYFGEFVCLAKDVTSAPNFKTGLLYMIMPPGWSPTGDHKTAKITRESFITHDQEIKTSEAPVTAN